tara:strand:- start:209 stop:2278 length:2070 start_codon:yes stop_codon:yes gene_type:complete
MAETPEERFEGRTGSFRRYTNLVGTEAQKRLQKAFDDAVESLVEGLGEESEEAKDQRGKARRSISKNEEIIDAAKERISFLENALEEWQEFLGQPETPTPREYHLAWRDIFGESSGFVKGNKDQQWWDKNSKAGGVADLVKAGNHFREKVAEIEEQISDVQPEKISKAETQIVNAESAIASIEEMATEAREPAKEARQAAIDLGENPSEVDIINWMLDSGFDAELDEVVGTERKGAEGLNARTESFEGRLGLAEAIADVKEERAATEDLAKERFRRPSGVDPETGIEVGPGAQGPPTNEITDTRDPMQIGLEEGLAAQRDRIGQARVTDPRQAVPEFGAPAMGGGGSGGGGAGGDDELDLTSRLGDIGSAFNISDQFGYRYFLFEPGTENERQDMLIDDPDNPGKQINVLTYITDNNLTNEAEILEAFKQTEWFNETSETMQNFDLAWDAAGPWDDWDNLTARREELISVEKSYIEDQLELLGITDQVDEAEINKLATFVKRNGMDTTEIRDYLSDVESIDFQSYIAEADEGLLATYKQSLETTASQYMIDISPEDMDMFVEGLYDADDPAAQLSLFKNHFRNAAKERFPTLTGVIDQGITPQQYFAPYSQRISKLLERPVDFMSERDSGIFDQIAAGMPDDKFGQRTMTFSEMNKYVRGLDEWQYTKNANDEARKTADNIGRMFGFVA